MNIQMKYSKMRSEQSEYMWKRKGYLDSLGELHWKICTGSLGEIGWILICILRCWTLMETILKKFREQSKEDDQMKSAGEIAGLVPETSLEWEPILKGRGGFWEGQRWISA